VDVSNNFHLTGTNIHINTPEGQSCLTGPHALRETGRRIPARIELSIQPETDNL